MLFNSYVFIFFFLPLVVSGFFFAAKYNPKISIGLLLIASLLFYSWNDYRYTLLLVFSIVTNFIVANLVIKSSNQTWKKACLFAGVVFNLTLLAYFKYINFFIDNVNYIFNEQYSLLNVVLPAGISFFTFTQIAFLVDAYRSPVSCYKLLNYALFVTYFPHLIAGPIIHHKEVMPQFEKTRTYMFNYRNVCIGLTIFIFGLFKKLILADKLGAYVSPVFDMQDQYIFMLDAWIGALAYTLELYFDFSAYSDMAIGISLILGIKLPINFYSPYKATSIIEFWRRWNMTLSRFLRDYLYIPLGGNRKGLVRKYVNLLLTMLLGGLWHGANWTFVAWGSIHGILLCLNHAWLGIKNYFQIKSKTSILGESINCGVTFLFIVIAWIFFRAPNFTQASKILNAMFRQNLTLPSLWNIPVQLKTNLMQFNISFTSQHMLVATNESAFMIIVGLLIVWFMPNTYQVFAKFKPALIPSDFAIVPSKLAWRPTIRWNLIAGLAILLGILNLQAGSMFLYFRF